MKQLNTDILEQQKKEFKLIVSSLFTDDGDIKNFRFFIYINSALTLITLIVIILQILLK